MSMPRLSNSNLAPAISGRLAQDLVSPNVQSPLKRAIRPLHENDALLKARRVPKVKRSHHSPEDRGDTGGVSDQAKQRAAESQRDIQASGIKPHRHPAIFRRRGTDDSDPEPGKHERVPEPH